MNTRDKVTEFSNQFVGKRITPELIKAFYQGLVDIFDLNVHPEDDFADYVETSTNEPTFMPLEVEVLNGIADKMFDYCAQNNLDICEIAMPDHMRQMFADNEQNLNEGPEGMKKLRSSEDIQNVFETGFIPVLQKMFTITPGIVNNAREMEVPGDYVLDSNSDSVWIDVMLSEEDIATIDAEINKYTELFKQFCEKNGMPGADVELFTDDGTVMFLINTDNLTTLSKGLGLRENRMIYKAPEKGKVVMKEDIGRTSPNDAIRALQPFLFTAEKAKGQGLIKSIMDAPMKNPQAYGDEVYFSMEMSDGTIDMVEYEFISGTIVLHQDLNGSNPSDDDISFDGFKKYLFSATEGSNFNLEGLKKKVEPGLVAYTKSEVFQNPEGGEMTSYSVYLYDDSSGVTINFIQKDVEKIMMIYDTKTFGKNDIPSKYKGFTEKRRPMTQEIIDQIVRIL